MMRSTGMHQHPQDIAAQRHVEGRSQIVIGFDFGTPVPAQIMIVELGKPIRFVDERAYFAAETQRQDLIASRMDRSAPWHALKDWLGGLRHGC